MTLILVRYLLRIQRAPRLYISDKSQQKNARSGLRSPKYAL